MGFEWSTKRGRSIGLEVGPFRLGRFNIKRFWLFRFNPVVTFFSAVLIWTFVIVAITVPELNQVLTKAKFWVTDTWTWLYIGTQDVWALFILMIFFSKYGHLKLGKDDEEPEFGDTTYFTMLFAAGIGTGLFYFGVAEPIYHYSPKAYGNRYWGRYTDNQRAQDAMNLTFFHWGIHGWIVYVLVGLLLGVIAYRNDLPMTMRSCFYPLLGDKVYGTLGDIIDTLSVICTMFGVCTSLGLGVVQLNAGLNRLNSNIKQVLWVQIVIIWAITAIATISVISGVKVGIRRLSEICFGVGMFVLLVVFFSDNTWYFMNVYCQSLGYYMQYIIQLGFHTDAFAQLGNAPDGKENPDWMDGWTMFYWGWWIAWSPFVGMFIAKISRGRTIRQFITYTLTIPILYTFLWFTVFGGAGLKMEREAQRAGITCDSACGGKNATEPCAGGLWLLSCRGTNDMWFDVVGQYEGIGQFMKVVSLIAIVLYFVTSSDSGSLIIDCLSANGEPEPPILQRIFWALTEGACATALLAAGNGTSALNALQSVSIIAGLFYTVILNFMCVALWRSLRITGGDLDPNGATWSISIWDPLYHLPRYIKDLAIAIVAPWYPLGKASARLSNSSWWKHAIPLAIPFYLWLLLTILQPLETGLAYIGWAVLFGFFAIGTGIRANIRGAHSFPEGNLIEDFFAVMLMYPMAAIQMDHHMRDSSGAGTNSYDLGKSDGRAKTTEPLGADRGVPNLAMEPVDEERRSAYPQHQSAGARHQTPPNKIAPAPAASRNGFRDSRNGPQTPTSHSPTRLSQDRSKERQPDVDNVHHPQAVGAVRSSGDYDRPRQLVPPSPNYPTDHHRHNSDSSGVSHPPSYSQVAGEAENHVIHLE